MSEWENAIVVDADVLDGKPRLAGTRISVDFVLELLASGWSEEDVRAQHELSNEQIMACLAYARDAVRDVALYPLTRSR